ncbi:hypothetical protein ZOSMA_425G00030 [Zostera marina]|uniref:Copine C-terminal domain-containing protein n=1 Tax=Zostera marina TaxID=29655 RepID=A0A0K9P2E4_ZOSMR|nr:hypothetical protein ZOSMA_425G00030 [Zostera marina]
MFWVRRRLHGVYIDTEPGVLSRQEKETIDAIVKSSEYALSIVVVGVRETDRGTR